jgi:hypothetical protein
VTIAALPPTSPPFRCSFPPRTEVDDVRQHITAAEWRQDMVGGTCCRDVSPDREKGLRSKEIGLEIPWCRSGLRK